MRGFSRNCSSHYDGNSTRMQSPTPVVCKHPRLQDYTSPLQVLQVASGDFLTQGASPLPPLLLTAHMKAGAASRGPRQVNSSRNHCRPQTSARTHTHTPSICAGEVKPALQTKTRLFPAVRVLLWPRVNTKADWLKANVLHQAVFSPQCCGGAHGCKMPHRGPTASGAGRKPGSAAMV